ncbi:predicted protein [Histoplasma capsulatum G186AR]|uniref:Uncharacterized protein n=1 Tax=Ajellomyces capsulatus (strain G186AR / H82 / ATCC MYA-2454 / RMSCC 2432) TaxID=447093 RepID=C0NVA4_AJECG|nr:uncharacterized protein HCBG_07084 [Histoplasma capsulatum G186AR]EEH04443.1 predicted protein [Histoplasma capsulatum G186AR]
MRGQLTDRPAVSLCLVKEASHSAKPVCLDPRTSGKMSISIIRCENGREHDMYDTELPQPQALQSPEQQLQLQGDIFGWHVCGSDKALTGQRGIWMQIVEGQVLVMHFVSEIQDVRNRVSMGNVEKRLGDP